MFLQTVDSIRGRSVADVAARSMQAAHFREVGGEDLSLNGLEAHIGSYLGSIQGVGDVSLRAAHVQNGRSVYLVAGFAPRDQFDRVLKEIDTAVRSFKPLTAQEADSIRPNRLDFYTVKTGDSWQSIAARGGGLVRASELAIMNDRAVNEQPQPGERIKIVVTG